MINSIRLRLALWHLVILAVLQISLCGGLYFLLYARMIYEVDGVLQNVVGAAESNMRMSLQHDTDQQRSARYALDTLIHADTPVVIRDAGGRVLSERPSGAARITPLPSHGVAAGDLDYAILSPNASQRIGVRRVAATQIVNERDGSHYYVAASQSLDASLAEFHAARLAFFFAVPILLITTSVGGWLLTGWSLSPVTAMSERARHIDADDMSERIYAENPRDELGQLAGSFNELLDRIAASSLRERQFMADAAHELRTPVAVIQTSVDVDLSKPSRSTEEYKFTLGTISTYAQRLSRSVDDVFRLARADAGCKVLDIHSVYLEEIVTEAVRAARAIAAQKNITVDLPTLPESPFRGDEALLGEMFLNLLENAVKYTPPNGAVRIEFVTCPTEYRITVADNGVGIHATDRARIFDRFFRGQPAAGPDPKARAPGSGLGLSIAQWIAKAHQGSLTLEASGESGSEFLVVLPRIPSSQFD